MYLRPDRLTDALDALRHAPMTLLSGGTDLYPALVGRPMPASVLDLSAIPELTGISRDSAGWRMGAAASWNAIFKADLPSGFAALQAAAREVGSLQIQNRGTIGGNLCNASPAADGIPPLLCLDASVELVSASGKRILPLPDFLLGYRRTALRPDEILAAVLVPDRLDSAGSAFAKLGARKHLVISIVMVAASLLRDSSGRISEARIAVGAASATARLLPGLAATLKGLPADKRPSSMLRHEHLAALTPIDDLRATAAYRFDAAHALVADTLDRAAGWAA